MVLCSGGCLTVAANSKNKETTTSLFFFSSSKEQGNRTGYPKTAPHIFGQLPCIPCPCRGRGSALHAHGGRITGKAA